MIRSGFLVALLLLTACVTTDEESSGPPPTLKALQVTATPTASPAATRLPPVTEPPTAGKGNADVTFVRAIEQADSTWTFHVTVQHPDTGWEDYADGWDVLTPDGTVLRTNPDDPFTRLLLHPHINEQPFTRSQSGISIAADVMTVRVRAHDLVDGFGGQEVAVDLQRASGPNFEVQRQP